MAPERELALREGHSALSFHINEQLPEKQVNKKSLAIAEVFHTIQGEGPFSGEPAVFVRLAGCNLQCKGCDTDYHATETCGASELLEKVKMLSPDGLVVITGGEPFRQNITEFVELLLANSYRVQIETNGTLALDKFPYQKVTIVCSPKTPKLNPVIVRHISAYKYVIERQGTSELDGLPTKVLGKQVLVARPVYGGLNKITRRKVFVQPFDDGTTDNLQAALLVAMFHGYRFSLQLHKLVGMP